MKIRGRFFSIIIGFTFFSIILIDFLYFFFKIDYGRIGVILWFFTYIYLFIFSLASLIWLVKISIKIKSFISLLMIILITSIILLNIDNPKNLSGETTQEIACAINQVINMKDMGFWQSCFFGYPTRQYYLPALPTFIFGRSLNVLNFGGTLYFITGLPIFVRGLWSLLSKKRSSDYLISIILSFFFHLHFFNFFMFLYEQSIFPLSFTLIVSGLILIYFQKRSYLLLFLIGIFTQYLIYSYTPSLFVFFLILVILVSFSVKNKPRFSEIFLIILLLFSFLNSLKLRSDIHILNLAERSLVDLQKDILDAFIHLFFQNKGRPFVSPIFNFIFLTSLIAPFFGIFGKKFILLNFWMLAVIFFSIISRGYSYYGVDFRLHRALVIFPILFIVILKIIKEKFSTSFLNEKRYYPLIVFIFLFFLLSGYFYHFNHIKEKEQAKHYLFIEWFKNIINFSNKNILLSDPNLDINYISLNDTIQYFLPQTTMYILSKDCNIIYKNNSDIYFIKNSDNNAGCFETIKRKVYINTFVYKEAKIDLYKIF